MVPIPLRPTHTRDTPLPFPYPSSVDPPPGRQGPGPSTPALQQVAAPTTIPFARPRRGVTTAPRLRRRGCRRGGPHYRPPRGAPRLIYGLLGSGDRKRRSLACCRWIAIEAASRLCLAFEAQKLLL
ncbi:hypothetical protein PVAP13_3NG211871 [Panicum virgatum]|uniref:Uncharacterized protein n=1 Tax=Panicum virgatum TaxID=38727 RepID=A0A8T0U918_PANVG|nr:hypothetical protein PVAP13_3NG211871 [Panicum virgatum]